MSLPTTTNNTPLFATLCAFRTTHCTGQKHCLYCLHSMDSAVQHTLPKPPAPRRLSSGSACEACRRRKTKCDGGNPCGYCTSNRVECIHRGSSKRRVATNAFHVKMSMWDKSSPLHWGHPLSISTVDRGLKRRARQSRAEVTPLGSRSNSSQRFHVTMPSIMDQLSCRTFTLAAVEHNGPSYPIYPLGLSSHYSSSSLPLSE